jgi:hypothetical protein
MLEGSVLSSAEFKTWSEKVVLYLGVTTHVKGDKDQEVWSEKGGQGWPYLVFLSADGEVLSKSPERSIAGFDAGLKASEKFLALKKKAADGDAAAKLEVFLKDLEFGNVKVADGAAQYKKMEGLDDGTRKKIEGLLADAEVRALSAAVNKKAEEMGEPTQDQIRELLMGLGKQFLEMHKAGRIPASQRERTSFWVRIMDAAEASKDAATFETALKGFKEAVGGDQRYAKTIQMHEERLQKLKGDAK